MVKGHDRRLRPPSYSRGRILVGAGALASLLLPVGPNVSIVLVGALMIAYVLIGGMVAATYVQIVKAVMIWLATLTLFVLVGSRYAFDFSALVHASTLAALHPHTYLLPGAYFRNPIDTLSLGLGLVLGTAGLPHIMTRFYTVPSSVDARNSARIAILIISSFAFMVGVIGIGATAIVGPQAILRANPAGNSAVPLLALAVGGGNGSLGGEFLFALISAVSFATILAVVSGIVLSSASTVAHDLYASILHKGSVDTRRQMRVARGATLILAAVSVGLALVFQSFNIAFLVGLAFAIAASANLPVILYSLYWRRFNEAGVLATVCVGVLTSVGMVVAGPAVIGPKGLIFHHLAAPFPLLNPGIVSIPCGFLAGWVATVLSVRRTAESDAIFESMELRALTGLGAEAPTEL